MTHEFATQIDHATQLADHRARIEGLEKKTDRIEEALRKVFTGVMATLVGVLIQIAIKLVWK